jgi:isopenicillin-N N-acyltransferase-like protein
MVPIQVLECAGTPYEIGFQHGRARADDVRRCHDYYCRFPGTSAADVDHVLDDIVAVHERPFAPLLDEMRGIADGAGLPYRHVLRLNFYADIVGESSLHCSNIGVADSPDGALIAKTIDLRTIERDFLFVQRVDPLGGQPYLHYTFAGTVWSEAGLTAGGLAHVCSGLVGRSRQASGVSVLALISMALLARCASVAEALALLGSYDVAKWGATLLLADRAGDLAMIEMLPGRKAVHRPPTRGDVLLHTNHCICSETMDMMGDAHLAEAYGLAGFLDNSQARYARLRELAPCIAHTREGLMGLLQDHAERGAICQHGAAGLHSDAGVVIAPSRGSLWGTLGYPCQSDFGALDV